MSSIKIASYTARLSDTGSAGQPREAQDAFRHRQAIDSTRDLHDSASYLGAVTDSNNDFAGVVEEFDVISQREQAVDLDSYDYWDRPLSQGDLAFSLGRLGLPGDPYDLEEAIQLHRSAVYRTPFDHPDRPLLLGNLAGALWSRYRAAGDGQDLKEVVEIHRQALDQTPLDHPDRASRLANLAGALESLYRVTGSSQGIQEAIQVQRQAVDCTGPDHPDFALRLDTLAGFLHLRYKKKGDD